ncbi:MAG: substrate-binding periplasmic protein, partial [Aeromonas veronii]
LRADKQQVARLQQALDKVRQGDEYKQLMKRYQLLSILPETTPTIPRLE